MPTAAMTSMVGLSAWAYLATFTWKITSARVKPEKGGAGCPLAGTAIRSGFSRPTWLRRRRPCPFSRSVRTVRATPIAPWHSAALADHGRPVPMRTGDRERRRHAAAASAYLVGVDAVALAAADRFTPTVVKDRVLRLTLGL